LEGDAGNKGGGGIGGSSGMPLYRACAMGVAEASESKNSTSKQTPDNTCSAPSKPQIWRMIRLYE
jgi:hypothetical protein